MQEENKEKTLITPAQYASVLNEAPSFAKSNKLYLPKRYGGTKFSHWIMENSRILLTEKDIIKMPKGIAIPKCICHKIISNHGFTNTSLIFDTTWMQDMANTILPSDQREKFLFDENTSKFVDKIILNFVTQIPIPPNVHPDLLSDALKNTKNLNFDSKAHIIRISNSAHDLLQKIITTYKLRNCILCANPCNSASILTCCNRAIHKDCFENCKVNGVANCPAGCTENDIKLKQAKRLEDIYFEKGDEFLELSKIYAEKAKKFEELSKKTSKHFLRI